MPLKIIQRTDLKVIVRLVQALHFLHVLIHRVERLVLVCGRVERSSVFALNSVYLGGQLNVLTAEPGRRRESTLHHKTGRHFVYKPLLPSDTKNLSIIKNFTGISSSIFSLQFVKIEENKKLFYPINTFQINNNQKQVHYK